MAPKPLHLPSFLPYQLSILQARISHLIGRHYREHWGLTRNSWRVMAALAFKGELSAKDIGQTVQLEKMQVSRAVKDLMAQGFIHQATDAEDRRLSRLSLTEEGQACYRDIVPELLDAEARLMAVLTPEERHQLAQITQKLLNHLD